MLIGANVDSFGESVCAKTTPLPDATVRKTTTENTTRVIISFLLLLSYRTQQSGSQQTCLVSVSLLWLAILERMALSFVESSARRGRRRATPSKAMTSPASGEPRMKKTSNGRTARGFKV